MSFSDAIIVHSNSSAVSEEVIAQLQHDYGPDKQIYILNVNPPPPTSGAGSVGAPVVNGTDQANSGAHPVQYIILNKEVDINVVLQDPNVLDQLSRSAIGSANAAQASTDLLNGGHQHQNHNHHSQPHQHQNEHQNGLGGYHTTGHQHQHQHQHQNHHLAHSQHYLASSTLNPVAAGAGGGHLKSTNISNLQNYNASLSNGGLHSIAQLNQHHGAGGGGGGHQYHVPPGVGVGGGQSGGLQTSVGGNAANSSLLNISNLNLNSEESIQRVDVPPPKRKPVEFHFENKRFSYQDAFLRFLAGEKQQTLPEIMAEVNHSHHHHQQHLHHHNKI